MSKATIFDIQRNSFVDGPGIRTTVFFKGCNLRCAWCHNPESQHFQPEILFYKDKCTGCGSCRGLTVENTGFSCPNRAKEICGKDYTAQELLQEILKDKLFYETSGGGVTFSGGECMLQIDFLAQLLQKCKENRIHTAVDTAGNIPWEHFEKILPHTDLFLYDVKTMDSQRHKACTGADNSLILSNLSKLLSAGIPLWVRVPVIPGVNDTEAEMEQLQSFFRACGYPEKTELLPYHGLGEHKYPALDRPSKAYPTPSEETLQKLRSVFA